MTFEMRIQFDEQTGRFGVLGMPVNPAIAYGMLEMAKDLVRQQLMTQKITQPSASDLALLGRK